MNVPQLMTLEEKLHYAKEALAVSQREQKRFGLQLHDGLCQELAGILMLAKSLNQKMAGTHGLKMTELRELADRLHGAIDQARDTARGLYPGELEGSSLMHCLGELASRTSGLSHVECLFVCPEPIVMEDNDNATHLYRIAEEGVSNAVIHGKAHRISVSLVQSSNTITLTIEDDGIGLKPGSEPSKGIGFPIMKYRSYMMDALFQVEPNTPHGVILKCILKRPVAAPVQSKHLL